MAVSQRTIAGLIPHGGTMCLLHEVLHMDEESITCRAVSHRDPDHPLREEGMLPALSGIEYAAQAMAVHGGLIRAVRQRPRTGLLVSVRDMETRVEYLSDYPDDLLIEAEQLVSAGNSVTYAFHVKAGTQELLSGRAMVVLDAEANGS